MKIMTAGHKYELENFERNSSELNQVIQFIEKEPVSEGSMLLKTVNDGTTNEDVLAVLINRMEYLQDKAPCRENAIVIAKLEEALMWLNKRTMDRKARQVEGTRRQ